VKVQGGFDDQVFYGNKELSEQTLNDLRIRGYSDEAIQTADKNSTRGINAILRAKCSTCHNYAAGGFISGPDAKSNFLSAVENSIAGEAYGSSLLRAVIPKSLGGFGDGAV
jgi:hypothetical protein